MKLISIIFFVFLCQIYSDEVTPSSEYSYFSEKEITALLENKSENKKWQERVDAYRDFLLRPNAEEYKEYRSVLQLEDEKDLDEYSYKAYPKLDISKEFQSLFGSVINVDNFIINSTFAALCSEVESAVLLDSVYDRVKRFYLSDNEPKIVDEELKAVKGDTDLSYLIRRFAYGVSKKCKEEGEAYWKIINKVMSEFGFGDLNNDLITLNDAYVFLNMCFLADDTCSDVFGTKVMALVKSINSDSRVKANNLGINYFKLNVSDIFTDLDKSVYFPLFVPKGSKLVYGPMGIIKYIMTGEMGMPIARVYGGKELKVVGNEIIDSECLLAPAKGLTNSIPIGPISSKNSKKVFTKDKELVTNDSEVYTRLSNDVSFKEFARLTLLGNADISDYNEMMGMITTDNTDNRMPLMNGTERKENEIGRHDTIAMLFDPITDKLPVDLPEVLDNPSGVQKDGWYGGYTIYHLPLKEVKGKILDAPLPNDLGKELKTVDGIIVEAAPEADIGKKIEDVSKYWVYENTKP